MERKYTILACLWVVIITFLSLYNLNDVPSVNVNIPNKDKIAHFMFYFVFVFLWYKAFLESTKKLTYIVLIAIIYGIVIEVLQRAITVSRQADFYDVVANVSGVLLATFIIRKKNISKKKF